MHFQPLLCCHILADRGHFGHRVYYSVNPMKYLISCTYFGACHSRIAFILAGFTTTPYSDNLIQIQQLLLIEWAFAKLGIKLIFPQDLQSNSHMLFMLFFRFGIYQNIIPCRNTIMNLSKYSLNTPFIKHMNVAGAFVSPKGKTVYS